MANHVRQQIVDAVVTAVTGLATTSTRVFTDEFYPFADSDLPCIVVISDGDSVSPETIHHPYQQNRTTQVRIEARIKAISNPRTTLSTICKEIETAIGGVSSGIAKDCYLQGTQIEFDAIGEQPVGKATLIYSKDLYTLSNAPDVLI